ncbi:MAG: histidine phosphatase family protein [Dorea sp.]
MRLYFVRHGETDWNKERRLQGQVDIPLNEFGRYLAVKTAKGLSDIPFDVCFSSPLGRAKETARLILEGRDIPIIEDTRIEEMGFAELEGKRCSKDEWEMPESFRKFFDDPEHFEPAPGGENFEDVKNRAQDFLQWLYKQEKLQGSTILVATHGAVLSGLLNCIKEEPISNYWGIGVHKNCAVTEVEVIDGKPRIISENQVYYDDDVKDW